MVQDRTLSSRLVTVRKADSGSLSLLFLSHLDPPANGQAVIYLIGLLEVFISESLILATVSDNSVRYQAINVVKRSKTNINGQKSETQTKMVGKGK